MLVVSDDFTTIGLSQPCCDLGQPVSERRSWESIFMILAEISHKFIECYLFS